MDACFAYRLGPISLHLLYEYLLKERTWKLEKKVRITRP